MTCTFLWNWCSLMEIKKDKIQDNNFRSLFWWHTNPKQDDNCLRAMTCESKYAVFEDWKISLYLVNPIFNVLQSICFIRLGGFAIFGLRNLLFLKDRASFNGSRHLIIRNQALLMFPLLPWANPCSYKISIWSKVLQNYETIIPGNIKIPEFLAVILCLMKVNADCCRQELSFEMGSFAWCNCNLQT